MKMLILTFKDHSTKRKRTNPCIQLPSGAPLAGGTTDLELSPLHGLAEYWPYSFKMSPKIAISMNDTDYANNADSLWGWGASVEHPFFLRVSNIQYSSRETE